MKEPILIHGNSLDIVKQFEDKTFDAIITDPPYNIAGNSNVTMVGGNFREPKVAWGNKYKDSWGSIEDYTEWLVHSFNELTRVLKDEGTLLVFLDRTYIGIYIRAFETRLNLRFRNKIYFIKGNPTPVPTRRNYRSTVNECAWFTKSHGKDFTLNFLSQKEMKQVFFGNGGSNKKTRHPTEKYEWMIEPLIIRHTNENDLILDPFAGAGSIGAVANRLNRGYVGIEKNKDFFEMAKKRLYENNLELF